MKAIFSLFSIIFILRPGQVICLAFTLLYLNACSNETKVLEPLQYSEEKMVEVLTDVHLTEAVIQGKKRLAKDSLANWYYGNIFELHKIDKKIFEAEMKRYTKRPQALHYLYEKVIDNISKEEAKEKGDNMQVIKKEPRKLKNQ